MDECGMERETWGQNLQHTHTFAPTFHDPVHSFNVPNVFSGGAPGSGTAGAAADRAPGDAKDGMDRRLPLCAPPAAMPPTAAVVMAGAAPPAPSSSRSGAPPDADNAPMRSLSTDTARGSADSDANVSKMPRFSRLIAVISSALASKVSGSKVRKRTRADIEREGGREREREMNVRTLCGGGLHWSRWR